MGIFQIIDFGKRISGLLQPTVIRNRYTVARQVTFFTSKTKVVRESATERMMENMDTEIGREVYSRRMGIVEPVFANIRSTHRLNRFSLRGRVKVNTQWQLFCLVHNLGKIHRYGMRTG